MKLFEKFTTLNPYYTNNVRQVDSRYTEFQRRGPLGLVLHSVGCPQPSGTVWAKKYNDPAKTVAVHAFIDANTGDVYQTLPWNYRCAHVGGSANNTHCGIEMGESSAITYTHGDKFIVKDKEKALAHCKTAYAAAVELFSYLCRTYKLDPLKKGVIISHNEARLTGVGRDHTDPEHYWKGLGVGYTMDGFRQDVKAAMSNTTAPTIIKDTADTTTAAEKILTVKVRQLQRGMEGSDVRTLQAALIANGFSCGSAGADGDFGSGTEAALKKFQTRYSLGADGIAGNGTWGKLLGK